MSLTVQLSEIAQIVQGGRLGFSGNDFVPDGFPAYGAGGNNGCLADFEFDCEAIVLSSIGARCGKCFHVFGKWASLANTQVILPYDELVNARFLWHQLNDETSWPRSGTAQPFIKPSDVKRRLVYLPALDEQRRIAAILDKAHGLREKRQEAICLADAFVRAAYLEMSKENHGRATVESVLADIPNAARTGPFGSQLLVSEFTDSGIPVLGIDNVVGNTFDWGERRFISQEKYEQLRRYTVRPGDVIITIMGTTGRVAVAPDNLPICISTKHLCTMTVDREQMCPEYLWACLRWDSEVRMQTQRESKGAIMEGWNLGIVKDLMISKPSMEVQRKFVSLLVRTNRIVSNARLASQDTGALISSLVSRYLVIPLRPNSSHETYDFAD